MHIRLIQQRKRRPIQETVPLSVKKMSGMPKLEYDFEPSSDFVGAFYEYLLQATRLVHSRRIGIVHAGLMTYYDVDEKEVMMEFWCILDNLQGNLFREKELVTGRQTRMESYLSRAFWFSNILSTET